MTLTSGGTFDTRLSPSGAHCPFMFVTARSNTSLSGANLYNYAAVSKLALLDGSGSIVHRNAEIRSQQLLDIEWSQMFKNYVTNTLNLYCLSFVDDPIEVISSGKRLGYEYLDGHSQLRIINATSTGSYKIEVNFGIYAALKIKSDSSVVKIQS